MNLRFTPGAESQFLAALAFIHADTPRAAKAFRARAESVLSRLAAHPASGRMIPEFPGLPYRELIVAPYRFFCRTEGKTVWVVAVWHGKQQVREPATTARADLR